MPCALYKESPRPHLIILFLGRQTKAKQNPILKQSLKAEEALSSHDLLNIILSLRLLIYGQELLEFHRPSPLNVPGM